MNFKCDKHACHFYGQNAKSDIISHSIIYDEAIPFTAVSVHHVHLSLVLLLFRCHPPPSHFIYFDLNKLHSTDLFVRLHVSGGRRESQRNDLFALITYLICTSSNWVARTMFKQCAPTTSNNDRIVSVVKKRRLVEILIRFHLRWSCPIVMSLFKLIYLCMDFDNEAKGTAGKLLLRKCRLYRLAFEWRTKESQF